MTRRPDHFDAGPPDACWCCETELGANFSIDADGKIACEAHLTCRDCGADVGGKSMERKRHRRETKDGVVEYVCPDCYEPTASEIESLARAGRT